MLDSSQCPTNLSTLYWTSLSWQIFNGLTNPALVLPILFILITLPWAIKSIRHKRRWSAGATGLLLIYLLALSPQAIAVGNQVLVQNLPHDDGTSADAIVVLGRGAELRQDRVNVAAQLWKAQRAPLIFASGMGDGEEIAQRLQEQSIPQRAIDEESCSRTTGENALFTASKLYPRHVRRIILVTDPPHMLRSALTFQGQGFDVISHPNPFPKQLSEKKRGFLVFREYLGLVSYKLQGRFDAKNTPSAYHA
ncbi:MAG: YdcF family protein [Candidatus Parcubacteria bacterium]|uniref:YdcF family protein n=1 Tax=Phormidesmis priestleyi TaxID=268141 RepID=UPI00083B7F4C|nr:YdcF family protein [Phormidesmis priestleyi]MBC7825065.1 YdcF family protein [Leptolyngbyaceae cyanobacterium LF-bin-113]